jgi:hypothetical protein
MYATTIGVQEIRENEDKYGNGRSRILEILHFFLNALFLFYEKKGNLP